MYVVFDILYLDTCSIINRTLMERYMLMRQTLAPQQTTAIPVGAAPHLSRRLTGKAVKGCHVIELQHCACGMCRLEVALCQCSERCRSRLCIATADVGSDMCAQGNQGRRGS